MRPENFAFGGGSQETTIYPQVAVYLLLAIILVLILPRRKAIAPFLFAFFTIPIEQVVVLGGFHFTALRFLILAALLRRVITPKTASDRFTGLDWAVVLWSISAAVSTCLLYRETGAVVKQAGGLIDILGGFLVVRFLVSDGETMRRTIKTLAALSLVLGICMVYEQVGHRNIFGYIGYPSVEVVVRNGKIRSGATLGCLHAGAFAGVLIPIFVWLWREEKSRKWAYVGLIGATAMVITSNSSTSYMALMGSFVGMAFWWMRERMRLIRCGLVMALVGLHMVMKAPVWALIQRIDLTGSSSGTQRYMLVDMTIRHFSDWWLFGTKEYVDWGWDSWDLCNQFVAVALTGGLLTLILYVAIFKFGFGAIGTARKRVVGDHRQEWFLWCLGSTLFATVVAHFGINYTAQLIMGFFALLAFIIVGAREAGQLAVQAVKTQDEKTSYSAVPSRGGSAPTPPNTAGEPFGNRRAEHVTYPGKTEGLRTRTSSSKLKVKF